MLRIYLTSIAVSRILVWSFVFLPETNSPVHRVAHLSVLNDCRRAPGAGYQHGDRKGCRRDTRDIVLNEIGSWIKDFGKCPILWLKGLAGTGKSTIAQTVSEWCFADGLLGASFFCSRKFKDRSDLHVVFPTLAFQLAHKYPAFRSILVPLLQSNPDVVHESLYNQMEKLIVEPLKSVDASMVIVIDALDECKDEEPSSAILYVFDLLVEQIPRVKFFITTRPEPWIKNGFRLPVLDDRTDILVLHDMHPVQVDGDIRSFPKHGLSEPPQQHQPEGWSSTLDMVESAITTAPVGSSSAASASTPVALSGASLASPARTFHVTLTALRFILLSQFNSPACQRLINRAFTPYELPSLIEAVFSSVDEVDTVRCLCGDDAQTFVDVIDQAGSSLARRCETRSTEINHDILC